MSMNELRSLLSLLGESHCLNTLRSVNVGGVQWNTQEIAQVLFPFLSAAPNLEDFTILDENQFIFGDENRLLYSPDFIC